MGWELVCRVGFGNEGEGWLFQAWWVGEATVACRDLSHNMLSSVSAGLFERTTALGEL